MAFQVQSKKEKKDWKNNGVRLQYRKFTVLLIAINTLYYAIYTY